MPDQPLAAKIAAKRHMPASVSAITSKMKMRRTVISFEQMTKYSMRKRLF
jgi:hypothetical protein